MDGIMAFIEGKMKAMHTNLSAVPGHVLRHVLRERHAASYRE